MGYIAIVDYGVGNLMSVENALRYLGLKGKITGEASQLDRADAVILPGVGAFPDAWEKLQGKGLVPVLRRQAEDKPVLGICLGMQMLFQGSEEVRPCPGLGFIRGRVRRIETACKLPHIGWNSLTFTHDSPLFQGIDSGAYVYFVHSFCGMAEDSAQVTAVTDYGTPVVAAVGQGNVYGTQFHPEKSGEIGLQMLRNFGGLNLC